jgi:glutathione S-transferase
MKLYFSPLACSMATRIALYEADLPAEFVEVDPGTKLMRDGADFRLVYELGLVPVLQPDDGGDVLTENAAVLQYVADQRPEALLAPTDARRRADLHQWLCYIGTELHKGIFIPLLNPEAHEAVKSSARSKVASRLSWVAKRLEGRDYLLNEFSVADAYLFTVLNWATAADVDMTPWPAIGTYVARVSARKAVARALNEEAALYAAEVARHLAKT